MKTILVATDFSNASLNAVNYAGEIAKRKKSKLILLHVYHSPIIVSDVTVMLPSGKEMEKDGLKHLRRIKKALELEYKNSFLIECICVNGFAVEEIIDLVPKHEVDLVVMGMHGVGYLEQKLLGSVTTSLIQKATFPVLVINKMVKYRAIKSITFATDYKEIKSADVLETLKDFGKMYKSHIYLLNVLTKKDNRPTIEQAAAGVKLEHSFEEMDHSFHYIKNESIAKGINEFTTGYKTDLLVMIPRKHNAFMSLWLESTTKLIAFDTDLPLLTLPD